MKVLIADASRSIRTMLGTWIDEFGYTAVLASDGEQALERAWREAVRIAIVDWEMEVMDGLEVCWRLRADDRSRHAHLILITARTDSSDALIQALDAGADDFIYKPFDKASLFARLRAATRILTMRRDLIRLAQMDSLTGTFNRRAFFERGNVERHQAAGRRQPLGIVVADIDHFKSINDRYGHAAGDEALRRFVATCQGTLLPSDILGRIGGEEFAALLPGSALHQATAVAERLRTAVAGITVRYERQSFAMTVSLGVAELQSGTEDIDQLICRADQALYRAKREGRNRVCLAEPAR